MPPEVLPTEADDEITEPLPDEAVAVRLGSFRFADFIANLEAYNAVDPHPYVAFNDAPYAASFLAWPGHSADETSQKLASADFEVSRQADKPESTTT